MVQSRRKSLSLVPAKPDQNSKEIGKTFYPRKRYSQSSIDIGRESETMKETIDEIVSYILQSMM